MSGTIRIKLIETAEVAITKFQKEYETLEAETKIVGIIDADKQRDLDSLSGKLKALRDLARNLRVVVTRNREMWDALSAAKAEFDEGLTVLQTAKWPDLAKLEAAAAAER